jgi:hypothetical protein
VTTPICAGGGTNAFGGPLSQAVDPPSNVNSVSDASALRRVGELGMQWEADERQG